MKKRRHFLFIVLALLFSSMSAQVNNVLKGYIIDRQNMGIEYCTISLLNPSDSTIIEGTISSKDGKYILPYKTNGKYILRVSFVGYNTYIQKISLPYTGTYNIILEESAQTLRGVQITANRIERKFNKYIVNMTNNPISEGKSIMNVLGLLPGVVNMNNSLSVNGSDVSEIYIDGRKITQTDELNNLQAADISRIEIIPNGGKRLRADNMGSVIKITLNRQSSGGYYGNVQFNEDWGKSQDKEGLSMPFSYRTGNFSFYNYIKLGHTNTPYLRDVTTTYDNSAKRVTSYSEEGYKKLGMNDVISMVYEINSRQNVGLTFNTIQQKTDENTFSKSDVSDEISYTSDYDQWGKRVTRQYQGTLNYNMQLDKKGSSFAFVADYLNNRNRYHDQRAYIYSAVHENDSLRNRTFTNSKQWKTTADWNINRWENTQFSFGGDYYSNKNMHNIVYDNYRQNVWENDRNLSDDFKYKGNGFGFYSEYTKTLGPVSLNAAARLQNDRISIFSKNAEQYTHSYFNFFPGMTVSFLINKKKNTRISLEWSRGMNSIRYSDMNPVRVYTSEIYYEKGNPDLKPVTWYYARMNFQLNNAWSLNYQYRNLKNEIYPITFQDETDPNVTYKMPVNTGRSYSHSLSIFFNKELFKWWRTNNMIQSSIEEHQYNRIDETAKRMFFYSSNSLRLSPDNGFMVSIMWEKGFQMLETYYHSVYNFNWCYYRYFLNKKLYCSIETNYFPHRSRILTVDNDIYQREEKNVSRQNYLQFRINYTFKGGKDVKAKRAKSLLEMQETNVGQTN